MDDQKGYQVFIPTSMQPPIEPLPDVGRVLPRQVSTGYTRGKQTVGFGPDALDGSNNRFIITDQTVFQDSIDNTKVMQLDMSDITTATTQTLTVPDSSGTIQLQPTGYTTFTPAPTGFSGTPTTTLARYLQQGKLVFMNVSITGTSNATTLTFTLPVTCKNASSYPLIVTDNGTVQNSPGLVVFTAASTTATCYKSLDTTAFTNSGTKALKGFGIVYEAN